MKRKRGKETRFEKIVRTFFILLIVVFAGGIVILDSLETSLNIDCHELEKDIISIQSDIDALEMQKQELASFSRISEIATKKGYTYTQNSTATAAIGVERE